jgi:hypothetical protein
LTGRGDGRGNLGVMAAVTGAGLCGVSSSDGEGGKGEEGREVHREGSEGEGV